MNLKIQRIILAILSILTFITIFIFSSQNGDKSGYTSRNFTRKVIEMLQIDKNLSEIEKENLIENSQFVIRKSAHFTIYMIAGIMIMGFCSTYSLKWNKKISITLAIGFIYAIFDELHQGITGGGRTPRILDICIDSLGVIIGGFIVLGVLYFIKNLKYSRKSESIYYK